MKVSMERFEHVGGYFLDNQTGEKISAPNQQTFRMYCDGTILQEEADRRKMLKKRKEIGRLRRIRVRGLA